MKNLINNIALVNGKYRKIYSILLISIGLIIGIMITDFKNSSQIGFFITAYILGVPCVIGLADRYPKLGNILGILSNFGEIIINSIFGNFGLAIAGIYYGITHIIGLQTWTKEENQDSNKRIKITNMNLFWTVFTVIFSISGLVFLYNYGYLIGFVSDGTLLGNIFFYGNLIAFILGILSQFLMIMRKAFAWVGWTTSNFFWFTLDFISGNIWFAIRDILYQINAILATYSWYVELKNQNQYNKNI